MISPTTTRAAYTNCLMPWDRSCLLCRKRKIKCNRELPCNNCERSRTSEACVYDGVVYQASRVQGDGHRDTLNSPDGRISNSNTTASTISRPSDVFTVPSRLTSVSSPKGSAASESYQPAGAAFIPSCHKIQDACGSNDSPDQTELARVYESSLFGQHTLVSHSVFHKGRLHGQSHWLNSVIQVSDSPLSSTIYS